MAIANKKVCESVISRLETEGIDKKKVVSFWKLLHYDVADYNLIDYRVQKENKDKFDGICIGISHAESGVDTDYLSGNWCNLAISSQDIFGQYKVLQYVFSKYQEKFSSLKYIVIDMFDWIYFNYDTSLSASALTYIGTVSNLEGIWHHYDENKLYVSELKVRENTYRCDEQKTLCDYECEQERILFGDWSNRGDCWNHYFENTYETIQKGADDFLKPSYMPIIAKKRNERTISENINIFKEMIGFLNDKGISIILVMLPRYYTIEEIHKELYADWKKEFLEILSEVRQLYEFDFIDFKEESTISKNHYFYRCVSHLNKSGAIAFTSLLNQYITDKYM